MPVTAPADRRFLRVHPRPGRRRRVWRRAAIVAARTAVVIAVGVYAGMRVADAAQAHRLFDVQDVNVSGTAWLSGDEVQVLVDDLRGQSLLRTDLEAWRSRLLACPWVADAVVRRRLPSTIAVRIVERHPMGIARLGSTLSLVDEDGTLIDTYGPKYAELDLPIVDGLVLRGQQAAVDPAGSLLAARVLRAVEVRPELLRQMSVIDVTDLRDAVVMLDGDPVQLHLGDCDFAERLVAYLDLAPRLHEHVEEIRYVDLRFGSQVFVGTPRAIPSREAVRGR